MRADTVESAEVRTRWGAEQTQRAAGAPHLFAVVTWGAAATTWLAKALNSHSEVLCFHHCNVEFLKFNPRVVVDGVDYVAMILAAGEGYQAVGDVHGLTRRDIPVLRSTFGDRLSTAVVVREPIARLRTTLAHFERSGTAHDERYRASVADYIDGVIDAAGITLPGEDFEHKLFVHAVNMLNAIVDERHLGPVYRAEDVTGDHSVFVDLVGHLSGGRVAPHPAWVERTLAMRPVNTHDPRDLRLEPWQTDVLESVVTSEAWDAYAELGYPPPKLA